MFLKDKLSLEMKLIISGFIVGLGLSSPAYFIPIFLQELGASYTVIGLIGSIRSTPYAILPILTGLMIAKYDMRKLYLLGAILSALGLTLLSFSQSFIEVGVANFLLGTSMVFYWPMAESIIAELFPEESRQKIYSSFSASWSTAYFIGPIIGGVLAESANLRVLFLVSALFCTIAIPFIYIMGELRIHEKDTDHKERKSIIRIWPIYVGVLLFTFGMACLILLVPSYLYQRGWTNIMVGIAFMVFGVSRTIAYILASRLKKINEVKLMLSSIIVQSLAIFLLAYTYPEIIFPTFILAGLVNGIYFVASFSIISRRVGAGYRGASIGLLEGVIGAGFIIGPGLSGFLIDYTGGELAFTITSLIVLLSIPFILIIRKL
ncbi:MAG: MFS transporter [Aigarchaeota archaeon]|nr:MFS transporter [Aigarchaeota archaeon]